MKKRNFLLLEILIAFSFVIFCIVPLVIGPIKMYRTELASLEKMEKERLADLTFCEIQELLLRNGIPWEKLPENEELTDPFKLELIHLQIPGAKLKKIERRFVLKCRREKIGKKGQIYRLLDVVIYLDDDAYLFRTLAHKRFL